ncbi:MAG: fenitrothion hydrolase [Actinomycetota bacterium]|nr:fenitrothion hydrolase [Actinomycetota bacterium]
MRRLAAIATAAMTWILLQASPAAAHGVGQRLDLPVPIWLFVYGAAAVVVVSFVALGILWKEPKLEGGRPGRPLPFQGMFRSRAVEGVLRTLSVIVFLVVFSSAAGGRDIVALNLAPYIVYIWFWVGMAFAHALFGNWWATMSPWDSIARFLGIGERPRRTYPIGWGVWPAAILLFGFVWLELVFPSRANPRVIAVAMAVYTVVTLGGMAVFGRDTWNRRGEAFAVYLRLLSLIAPFARDEERRAVIRPPLAGLPTLEPRPGLVALVMVVIGSTIFDGFSSTTFWTDSVAGLGVAARAVTESSALLAAIVVASGAYALSMLAASAISGVPWHPLSVRFVHSLVPIAFAYVTAHYFSLLFLDGQIVIGLASDPFGLGWNLFGTATYEPNLLLLSAFAIWYVQVAAIVLGHVAGVLVAHDRALAAFPGRMAVRTQYALLGVMVLFTMGGLLVLSAG